MSEGADSGPLAGRRVIVTGGARGIGRSMVELFRAAGASVLAADVSGLDELTDALPGVDTITGDISNPADADAIIAAAGPRLDVICNNAGILDHLRLAAEVSDEEWERVIAVNLTGTFRLCRRALVVMLEQGHGVITNTASIAAFGGGRAGAAYTASKAGVVALTQCIAVAYGERGIRCNAICPGGTATSMAHTNAGAEDALSAAGLALLGRLTGKPKPATPDRIAEVAVFLARDEASRINGVALPVDGGLIAY
jgi:NAD(P)-dependent dehydrogenase (short-subunit alcohol dehydrogenase family)